MTRKEALAEANRRWFVPNPNGGDPLCHGLVSLGTRAHPCRYQVGRSSGGPLELMGASPTSWEDAFRSADEQAKGGSRG